MKKIIRLTESDLVRLVNTVIKEQKSKKPMITESAVNEQTMDVAKNIGASTLYGASSGAAAGSVVPVAGTAVGAAVGGIAGALSAGMNAIVSGTGASDQKVKQFCDLCAKTKAPITQKSNQLADMIRDAVQGAGTDETDVYKAFNSLKTFDEFCSLVTAYRQSYNTELYADLDSDIDSEGEWVGIFRPIRDAALRQSQPAQKTTGGATRPGPNATRPVGKPTPKTVGNPNAKPPKPGVRPIGR